MSHIQSFLCKLYRPVLYICAEYWHPLLIKKWTKKPTKQRTTAMSPWHFKVTLVFDIAKYKWPQNSIFHPRKRNQSHYTTTVTPQPPTVIQNRFKGVQRSWKNNQYQYKHNSALCYASTNGWHEWLALMVGTNGWHEWLGKHWLQGCRYNTQCMHPHTTWLYRETDHSECLTPRLWDTPHLIHHVCSAKALSSILLQRERSHRALLLFNPVSGGGEAAAGALVLMPLESTQSSDSMLASDCIVLTCSFFLNQSLERVLYGCNHCLFSIFSFFLND